MVRDALRVSKAQRILLGILVGLGTIGFTGNEALAQSLIVPDGTLGSERSQVEFRATSERITGGATRGINLFHSFQELNVGEGRTTYFIAPNSGIENILTRVTGSNRSDILGRLGVLGNANLFLLNPNGIVFGPQSSLDVVGSFTATTANAIGLGDRGFFSATQPQQSSLLSITPGAFLYNQIAAQNGDIVSLGNLIAGKDLTLSATNLNLQGQLQAGQDLIFQGQDTVKIRDTITTPFTASSGRNLLVQGDRTVDIFALNHPKSGLFSGSDMVLRSASPVGGDAHYWSGGNFRIENLSGSGGGLFSPNDPIVVARGDVSFDTYNGASLHIFAGGSVTVTTGIAVTAPDLFFGLSEDVSLSDGTIVAIRGTSEPTVDIRAGIDQALFTGEGINTLLTGSFTGSPGQGFFTTPTGSDINIGAIFFSDGVASIGGKVLLTNQYQPNRNLPNGGVRVSAIPTIPPGPGIAILAFSPVANGGSVFIDSRGDIRIDGAIAVGSNVGNGGDVRLIAGGNMNFAPTTFTSPQGDINIAIQSVGSLGGNIDLKSGGNISVSNTAILSNGINRNLGGKSGRITLDANSIFLTNDSRIATSGAGGSEAGDIKLFAKDTIQTLGTNSRIQSDTGVDTGIVPDTLASGGKITLRATSLFMDDGFISATTRNRGNAGSVDIQVTDSVLLQNRATIGTNVQAGSTGNGGPISVRANSLDILSGSQINSIVEDAQGNSPPGRGNAGTVNIDVTGAIRILGDKDTFQSGVSTRTAPGTIGNGGNIKVSAGALSIESDGIGAGIFANVAGNGNAGNIDVDIKGLLKLTGFRAALSNVVTEGATGNAGNISVNAGSIEMTDFSFITSSHAGAGTGRVGNISIRANDSIFLGDDANIQAGKGENVIGTPGDIEVAASKLTIQTGGLITAFSLGGGDAGNIQVLIAGDVVIDGISSPKMIPGFGATRGSASGINSTPVFSVGFSSPNLIDRVRGNSGNIYVAAHNLTLSNGGNISNVVAGRGNSGSILVRVKDDLLIQSGGTISSDIGPSGNGIAGNVNIQTRSLTVTDGSQITSVLSRTQGNRPGGQGQGGDIRINAADSVTLTGTSPFGFSSGLLTLSERDASGSAGDIFVNTRDFRVADGAIVVASTFNQGNAGNITITTENFTAANGGQVVTNTRGSGRAGTISLNVSDTLLLDGRDPNFGDRTARINQYLQIPGVSDLFDDVIVNVGAASGLFTNTGTGSTGSGGNIVVGSANLNLDGGGQISAQSQGIGRAGNIVVGVRETFNANDGSVLTNAQFSGGDVNITAKSIRLRGDSDITTNVTNGAGGNITLSANSILAFNDSDILSFAQQGQGGNITLNTRAFFGQNYRLAPFGTDPATLDGNDRVDINASGSLSSGTITTPDTSFIQNSLNQLPKDSIDTTKLLSQTCLVRKDKPEGTFYIVGAGGLPNRPGDLSPAQYPTNTIQPTQTANRPWQKGDPIVEPTGFYQLANGRLVISRECQSEPIAQP